MYAHFYQLAEDPFNLTPDPKFHYVNESTREALASILHGLKARKGFLTLIGEAGTGKTTLLKRILDEIEGETQVVFVFNPGVSFDELLEFICSELGIAADGRRRLQMLERLNEYLLEQLTAGRNVVVMIDEAQTLSDAVLEELRLLSNLETSKEKILQILLAGQPELEEKLRRPGLRQLRQRIAVRATLKPMRLTEIGAYVQTRLHSAGASRDDLFTKAALHKIWRSSKGIPRVVNVICDNAMMIAFAEGKKRIGYSVAVEAVRDLEGSGRRWGDVAQLLRHWMGGAWIRYAAAAAVALAVFVPLNHWMQARRDARLAAVTSSEAVRQVREAARQGRPQAEVPAPDRRSGGVSGTVTAVSSVPARGAVAVAASGPDEDGGQPAPVARRAMLQETADAAARALGSDESRPPDEGVNPSLSTIPAAESEDAAEVPVTADEAVAASIRRAQAIARATAARLFDERKRAQLGSPEELRVALPQPSAAPAGAAPAQAGRGADSVQKHEEQRAAVADSTEGRAGSAAEPGPSGVRESRSPVRASGSRDASTGAQVALAEKQAASRRVSEEKSPPATERARPASHAAGRSNPGRVGPRGLATELSALDGSHRTGGFSGGASGHAVPAEPTPPATVEELDPIVGRLIAVDRGDTIWDIAIEQYGTAGPKTLRRILAANPAIEDPRHLEVGSRVVLPFVRADQMVERGARGQDFRVVLAAAPDAASLAATRSWAQRILPSLHLRLVSSERRDGELLLVVDGVPSRQAAMSMADVLLEAHLRAAAADAAASKRSSELTSLIP